MNFEELKCYFHMFRCGYLSCKKLVDAIALWQAPAPRRRMSIERLALCHVAVTGKGIPAISAAAEISHADRSGILYGLTFAQTLALNRFLLDLYEEEAYVSQAAR
jgi:hypothetical protein